MLKIGSAPLSSPLLKPSISVPWFRNPVRELELPVCTIALMLFAEPRYKTSLFNAHGEKNESSKMFWVSL